jgi:adenine-specific DNA-methyltransferase
MKTIQSHRQPVAHQSPDPNAERLAQLRQLIPEAFTEGQIDWEKLRAALGGVIDDGPERYTFSWAGKRDAIRLLQTPTAATLVPCSEESVDFEATRHVFIEGENLEALKLMLKPYHNRVKMIYIDPPYNTGNDFIYPDDYSDPLGNYLRLTGQVDAEGNLLTSNPETSGRYHSAWLSMIYPRLFLARQLLCEDGIIFVSLDEVELCDLLLLMNEVFGEENRVAVLVWKKAYGGGGKVKQVMMLHEYILCYARSRDALGFIDLPPRPETRKYYTQRDEKHEERGPFRTQPLATTSMDERPNLRYPIYWHGQEIWPDKQWQWSQERVASALENDELVFTESDGKWSVYYKQYLYDEQGEERGAKPYSVLDGPYTQEGTAALRGLFEEERDLFPFPKPPSLLSGLIDYIHRDEEAIIMDFFSGSSTTAAAVLASNRDQDRSHRFMLVQLPEPTGRQDYPSIADIGKERIRRVIARMKEETEGQLDLSSRGSPEDLGFRVFKLAPSHYRRWQGVSESDPEAYTDQMGLFTDPLVEGWRPMDVLWEVAIKEGYRLDSRVKPVPEVTGQTVYRVSDPDDESSFLICLDDRLELARLRPLGLTRDTLFVCRDVALDDDAAANLALQCRLKTI